jgi:hypothetical protein
VLCRRETSTAGTTASTTAATATAAAIPGAFGTFRVKQETAAIAGQVEDGAPGMSAERQDCAGQEVEDDGMSDTQVGDQTQHRSGPVGGTKMMKGVAGMAAMQRQEVEGKMDVEGGPEAGMLPVQSAGQLDRNTLEGRGMTDMGGDRKGGLSHPGQQQQQQGQQQPPSLSCGHDALLPVMAAAAGASPAVEVWVHFVQGHGEVVFIPEGCPYQVQGMGAGRQVSMGQGGSQM